MIIHFSCDTVDENKHQNTKFTLVFKSSDSFAKLIKEPYSKGFLPTLEDSSVWALERGDFPIISTLRLKNDKFRASVNSPICPKDIGGYTGLKDGEHLHFKYYPTLIDYGEKLFVYYGGSHWMMWHEGFIDEYQDCAVPEEKEREWRVKYGLTGSAW